MVGGCREVGRYLLGMRDISTLGLYVLLIIWFKMLSRKE